jgi:hypothetical protein
MKKLELKHLAPYLPYELKFLYNGNIYKMRWINSNGDIDYDSQNDFINPFPPNIFSKELDVVKLMFRPLSDLTKEIEVNGEKFIPINKLLEHNGFDLSKMSKREINNYIEVFMPDFISLRDSELLFEWYFDVFGLIEQDLAIDINTLEL